MTHGLFALFLRSRYLPAAIAWLGIIGSSLLAAATIVMFVFPEGTNGLKLFGVPALLAERVRSRNPSEPGISTAASGGTLTMGQMKAYPSFDAYLKDQPRANQTVIRALRKLVKRAAPSLEEAVKYGNGCWVQGKYPIAYVYAAADHTQFGFLAGSKLADPKRLLAGDGRYVRHVRLRTPRDLVERDLVALLEQAVELGHPAAKKPTKAEAPKPRARRADRATRPATEGRTAKARR